MNLEFSLQLFEKYIIIEFHEIRQVNFMKTRQVNFMKIRQVGGELFHSDMTKRIVVFRNSANALKKAGPFNL